MYPFKDCSYQHVSRFFQVTSKLSPHKPYIDNKSLESAVDAAVATDHVIEQLQSLSVLELSLVIAMKHALDIFDGQPMNFEMVLHRYTKFANTNSSSQTVPRPVILKAFEHLQALEIITPVKNNEGTESSTRVQKEYQLYTLSVVRSDIEEAVKKYRNLPTEILQWLNNSIE